MLYAVAIMVYVFVVGFVGSGYIIASAVLALMLEAGERVPPLLRR